MQNPHSERITDAKFLPPWLDPEHEARYVFSRAYITGKRVLDFGCGEGKGSRSMAKGEPRMMIAADLAVDAVALLRRERPDAVRPIAASADHLPVRSESLDAVIALEVIEHFPDPERFVREVSAILKSDGVFVCSTPNRVVRNPVAPLASKPLNPWHLREWTPEEFEQVLGAGFEDVEFFGQEAQSRRVTRLFNAVGRVWMRGAAILRQLVKFRLLAGHRKNFFDVTEYRKDVDFEFVICVCRRPRKQRTAK